MKWSEIRRELNEYGRPVYDADSVDMARATDSERCCGTCKSWRPDDECDGRMEGECLKMPSCFCCNHDTQIAGAIGGGDFRSFAEFGCILWEAK